METLLTHMFSHLHQRGRSVRGRMCQFLHLASLLWRLRRLCRLRRRCSVRPWPDVRHAGQVCDLPARRIRDIDVGMLKQQARSAIEFQA